MAADSLRRREQAAEFLRRRTGQASAVCRGRRNDRGQRRLRQQRIHRQLPQARKRVIPAMSSASCATTVRSTPTVDIKFSHFRYPRGSPGQHGMASDVLPGSDLSRALCGSSQRSALAPISTRASFRHRSIPGTPGDSSARARPIGETKSRRADRTHINCADCNTVELGPRAGRIRAVD